MCSVGWAQRRARDQRLAIADGLRFIPKDDPETSYRKRIKRFLIYKKTFLVTAYTLSHFYVSIAIHYSYIKNKILQPIVLLYQFRIKIQYVKNNYISLLMLIWDVFGWVGSTSGQRWAIADGLGFIPKDDPETCYPKNIKRFRNATFVKYLPHWSNPVSD